MVFIDEKGRIFGKINLLDLMFIGLLLLILLAVITLTTEVKIKEEELIKTKVLLKVSRQHKCFIDSINKGDTEIWDGKIRAKVNKIYREEITENNSTITSNEVSEKQKNILIELDLFVTEDMGKYWYLLDQEMGIKKKLIIRLNSADISGVVTEYEIA